MPLSKKDRDYLRGFGRQRSVKELAKELGCSKQEIRSALSEMERAGAFESFY